MATTLDNTKSTVDFKTKNLCNAASGIEKLKNKRFLLLDKGPTCIYKSVCKCSSPVKINPPFYGQKLRKPA